MCHIQQQWKPHPLMGYTERSRWQDPTRLWLAGGARSQPGIGVSGARVSANTQRIFTHAQEQAGKINSLWQHRMVLSFPSAASWGRGSVPPHLQAGGRAKATSSHPKSRCEAKTQLRPIPADAVAPQTVGKGRSPPGTVTPPACHAAASQARTVFFLQSPLGPGSNLKASAPNHPGLQELKKTPIRGPGSWKHKSV